MSAQNKKLLKELNAQIKVLQEKLAETQKLEGKDAYIDVKTRKSQSHFRGKKPKNFDDTVVGYFYLKIDILSKQRDVYVPISVATGKKTAGFMYQIEGTSEASVASAEVKTRGEGLSQITVGTIHYARIRAGQTASFDIKVTIRGRYGKSYKLVFTRLNYKLETSDARYQQYLKEINSKEATFTN